MLLPQRIHTLARVQGIPHCFRETSSSLTIGIFCLIHQFFFERFIDHKIIEDDVFALP